MIDHQNKMKMRFGLGFYLNLGLSIVFAGAALYLINEIKIQGRDQALLEAKTKAQLISDRNLAARIYFSHTPEPSVFGLTVPVRTKD